MSPFSNLCHFAILCMRALSMSGFVAIHNIFIAGLIITEFSQPKLSRCSLFNFRWHGIEFWFEGIWIKASRLSPKNPSVSQTPYLPQPPDRFHTFQRRSSRISIAIQIEFKLLKNEIILNFHLLDWGNYPDTMLCQRQVITFTSKSRQYKNWQGKIVTILFYTDRPNSLIPSPFLSNISLAFRLTDNFKGCSDARPKKLFHITRNGQLFSIIISRMKRYFLLKTAQIWSQYGFVAETRIRRSWALSIKLVWKCQQRGAFHRNIFQSLLCRKV